MRNQTISPIKIIFFVFVLITCILAGIWIGFNSYLSPGNYPAYLNDWHWVLLYGALLILGFSLVWLYRGRVLFILTISFIFLMIGITTVRAGLVKELFALFFILITSLSLGDGLLGLLIKDKVDSHLERLMLGFSLGFGGLMLVGLFLGIIGAYTWEAAYISIGILLILTLPSWLKWIKQLYLETIPAWKNNWTNWDFKLIALIAFIMAIFLAGPYLWATAPAIRWDALSYHVAAPQIYVNHHAMVEIPESVQTYWAHFAEMAYTLGLLLGGQPLPGWMHLITGAASAIFSGLLGSRLVNWRVGLIAALIFITLPLVNYEIGTAYIEGFTTLYSMAMLLSGINWLHNKSNRWLALSGIFSGFALGLKLNAFPFVFTFYLFVAIYIARERWSWNNIFKTMAILIAPTIILWAPWLIRDAMWTGNPIFPNYNWLFNSPKWGAQNFFALGAESNRFIDTLKIPWDIVMKTSRFYHEAPGGVLLSLPWLALPWFLWLPSSFNRSQKRNLLMVFCFTTISTLLLFSIVKNLRYLMPVYPLLCILAGSNLDALWRQIKGKKISIPAIIIGAILSIGYLLASQASILIRMPTLDERYPYHYAMGVESKIDFLRSALPFYPIFEYLNKLPEPQKVFSLGIEFRLYTDARIYGGLFSYEVQQILKESQTPADLAEALKINGFEYLLVYTPDYYLRPNVYSSKGFTPDFINQYATIVAADNRAYLYRLNFVKSGKEAIKNNLLEGSNFEISGPEFVSAWRAAGNPQLDRSGKYSYTGNSSALLSSSATPGNDSALLQTITIEGGKIYTLDTWAKEYDPGATLQLMVVWIDQSENPIQTDYDWIGLSPEWRYYWLSAEAPINASKAEVSLAVFKGGSGFIDDTSFSTDQGEVNN